MHFQFTALLAATAALAAPVSVVSESEASSLTERGVVGNNKATCTGFQDAFWNINSSAFKVTIGRPFLGGGRCPDIRAKVSKHIQVDSFKCSGANGNKNTVIKFTSNMGSGNLAKVNKALKAAYPEISFSCPTQLR